MGERSYKQFCSIARALDIVGERWTLLIIRDLVLSPRRFKDLLEGLPGIGANLLTTRLKKLEKHGIVERAVLPPPAGTAVYQLTALGSKLEPVILELTKWGLNVIGKKKENELVRDEWKILAKNACTRKKN